MKYGPLIKEFQPVALLAALIACLYWLDLGIVRAVAAYWSEATGHGAGFGLHGPASTLLDDGVCFALFVLLVLLVSLARSNARNWVSRYSGFHNGVQQPESPYAWSKTSLPADCST